MANRDWGLNIYDRDHLDYDIIQQFDQEVIQISAPPLWIYRFNLESTLKGANSGIDNLYVESDMLNEEEIMKRYKDGMKQDFDSHTIKKGEIFDLPIKTEGYYQEPTWTNELSRMGFPDVEEELSIVFNYRKMLADLGREIRIGDVIKTFRNKIYRVTSAFAADESVGWKFLHFNVIAVKPTELSFLVLPDDPNVPKDNNVGI